VKVTDSRVEYGFLARETPGDTANNPKAREIIERIQNLDKDFNEGKINELKYNALKDELDMKLIFTGAKREEIIQNKSGLTTAINAYKRAKLNFEYTKISAPFNGTVGDFDLVKGQRISAGQKLCKLFNTSTLRIDVGVLENDITKIKVGNLTKVEVPSITGETFSGRVVNVSPYIDKETKTCKVTIQIQTGSNKLKPGMFAKVLLLHQSETMNSSPAVPEETVQTDGQKHFVFVPLKEGYFLRRDVAIGARVDGYVKVISGLNKNERVVVKGGFLLKSEIMKGKFGEGCSD
jgi:RND family efflux transporter MFP subunit